MLGEVDPLERAAAEPGPGDHSAPASNLDEEFSLADMDMMLGEISEERYYRHAVTAEHVGLAEAVAEAAGSAEAAGPIEAARSADAAESAEPAESMDPTRP